MSPDSAGKQGKDGGALAGRSSPKASEGRSSMLRFLLIFAAIYLLTTAGLRLLFPDRFAPRQTMPLPVTLTAEPRSVPFGRNFAIVITNQHDVPLALPDRCPEPPLVIERAEGKEFAPVDASSPALPCTPLAPVPPGGKAKIDLSPWKYSAFGEAGQYRVTLAPETLAEVGLPAGSGSGVATLVTVKEPSGFVRAFRAFISKPLLNGLVLIASVLPGHSLGWSIIFLTILVKLALFFPSQHALHSQKKLQAIQPKIEEIKRKHDGDQQRITEETMKLWRTEKINPLQSCLPTVLQIPILLGLFFIIRDSGTLELARHLLYPPFTDLGWTFGTHFLGALDLHATPFGTATWWPSAANAWLLLRGAPLPLLTSLLQFFQMRLMMAQAQAKQGNRAQQQSLADRMNPQTMMQYMLPIMIFFISGRLPAAVSLYWLASTVFAIGQQMIVNRAR